MALITDAESRCATGLKNEEMSQALGSKKRQSAKKNAANHAVKQHLKNCV